MKVIVYVEGKSDVDAMRALLKELISEKKEQGIAIEFFETPQGDRKKTLLTKVPLRAVDILRGDPNAMVIALPDLYPPDVVFPHRDPVQLQAGVMQAYRDALHAKGLEEELYIHRFHVFCFKHDLEALVLAAEESLRRRLGETKLRADWTEPVEDQNHDTPPKRVVERLYADHQRYYGAAEASFILGEADYREIAERCPQCFKPFVDFLTNLSADA